MALLNQTSSVQAAPGNLVSVRSRLCGHVHADKSTETCFFPHHGSCTWFQTRFQAQIRTRHWVILFRGLRKKSPPCEKQYRLSLPPSPQGPMLAATRVFLGLRKKSPFTLVLRSLRCAPTLDLGGMGASCGVKFMSDGLFFRRPRNP